MKTVAIEDAVGQVLCHDMTRIVKGEMKGPQFKKGHIIREEDIPMLLSMGKERIYVWEKPTGFVHEDEAAETLDALCRGNNIARRGPVEGKIEHFAEIDGILCINLAELEAVNSIEGLIVATRAPFSPVKTGELVAGMKSVPLVIAEGKLRHARALCPRPILEVLPYTMKTAGIVTTGSEIAKGRITDTFTPVVQDKLRAYGIEAIAHEIAGDDVEEIAAAITRLRSVKPDIIFCTGGMSVDPDDGTPSAIRHVIEEDGGHWISYGVPVMPGVMFLLAYFADGVPIAGLPGCVMFARITVFDLLLPRIAAGIPLQKRDLSQLATGGLCLAGKGCNGECHYPNCGFG